MKNHPWKLLAWLSPLLRQHIYEVNTLFPDKEDTVTMYFLGYHSTLPGQERLAFYYRFTSNPDFFLAEQPNRVFEGWEGKRVLGYDSLVTPGTIDGTAEHELPALYFLRALCRTTFEQFKRLVV